MRSLATIQEQVQSPVLNFTEMNTLPVYLFKTVETPKTA
jgi:hypothetical protein